MHNRLEAHRRKMAGYRRAWTQRHSWAKICVATCERVERGKAETALLCQELIINKWGTELTKRLKIHLPPCVKENRPNYQDLRHKQLTKKQRPWWSFLGLFYHSDMLKKKKKTLKLINLIMNWIWLQQVAAGCQSEVVSHIFTSSCIHHQNTVSSCEAQAPSAVVYKIR